MERVPVEVAGEVIDDLISRCEKGSSEVLGLALDHLRARLCVRMKQQVTELMRTIETTARLVIFHRRKQHNRPARHRCRERIDTRVEMIARIAEYQNPTCFKESHDVGNRPVRDTQ